MENMYNVATDKVNKLLSRIKWRPGIRSRETPQQDDNNDGTDVADSDSDINSEQVVQDTSLLDLKEALQFIENLEHDKCIRHESTETTHNPVTYLNLFCRSRCPSFSEVAICLLKFFFSQVGLVALVVGYAIIGGLIFHKLEGPFEDMQRMNMRVVRQSYIEALLNVSATLDAEEWKGVVEETFRAFEIELYKAIKDGGYNTYTEEAEQKWGYTGALLYSVTVITTIGYGNITPKSSWGRVATIFYAVFGIPLTLLCLSNLGTMLGDIFCVLYERVCCYVCKQRKRKRQMVITTVVKPGGDVISLERISLNDSYDSCLENQPSPSRTSQMSTGPTPSQVSSVRSLQVSPSRKNQTSPDRRPNKRNLAVRLKRPHLSVTRSVGFTSGRPTGEVRIPVWVTLSVLAGYIFGGAMLFAVWEKDWDYLIASYFCFVTLTTIGFGDFVPGSSQDSWASHEKRVLCSMYLMFGLALMAMSFKLMQQQVKASCRKLARRVGFVG